MIIGGSLYERLKHDPRGTRRSKPTPGRLTHADAHFYSFSVEKKRERKEKGA
jgi:hypothetical protein